jgi:long-chain acyl-CoA synthetase
MILDPHVFQNDDTALVWNGGSMCYRDLVAKVALVSEWLLQQPETQVALIAENSAEWVVCDLAAQQANKVLIPVPVYFSQQQRRHLFHEAGIGLLIADCSNNEENAQLEGACQIESPFENLLAYRVEPDGRPCIPRETGKITFTSGSTGQPKGVCLSNASQFKVAKSLSNAVNLNRVKHLCLLPLPTLLENIAGVYAPLLVGGCVVLPSSTELGFTGAALNNPQAMLSQINRHRPETLILVPELLLLLVSACQKGWVPPTSLTFIAVGGAHVASDLLESARALGLPVFEGYGLSEGVSVNTLNLPGKQKDGSVGESLGHNQLSTEDGELIVKGNIFLGYLNQPNSFYPSQLKTGDLVSEEGGYFHIQGRKKNLIITSLGRNISPEWIESALTATGYFQYVLIVGEGQKACSAILVKRDHTLNAQQVAHVIASVNHSLPEYARIATWHTLDTLPENTQLLTANGKLRREQALKHFHSIISQLNSQQVA